MCMMCMSGSGSWMVKECMAVSERRKPSTWLGLGLGLGFGLGLGLAQHLRHG